MDLADGAEGSWKSSPSKGTSREEPTWACGTGAALGELHSQNDERVEQDQRREIRLER